MASLKVYGVGNDGFVSPAVIAALGQRPHVRKANVYLIAHSKAEAVRVADAVGFRVWPNSAEFRQAGDIRLPDGSIPPDRWTITDDGLAWLDQHDKEN